MAQSPNTGHTSEFNCACTVWTQTRKHTLTLCFCFSKRNLSEIPGVVAHTADPSTLEVEAERCEWKGCKDVQGCPLLCRALLTFDPVPALKRNFVFKMRGVRRKQSHKPRKETECWGPGWGTGSSKSPSTASSKHLNDGDNWLASILFYTKRV